jgi:hypothetical protein
MISSSSAGTVTSLIKNTDTDEQSETPPPSSTSKIFGSLVSEVKLNYKTIFNACVNAIGTLISTTYWIGQLTDDMANLDGEGADEYFADMSSLGLPMGVGFGLLITVGSVYAHYILNTNSTYAIKHQNYLIRADDADPRIALSWVQKFLLSLDFLSHAADSAGPALLIISVGTNDPSRLSKILAQTIATLIGSYSAATDAVTCGHNMRIHNRNVLLDSLQPKDTPAYLQAQFYQQEMRELQKIYASINPLAVAKFKQAEILLSEAADELEAAENAIVRRDGIQEFGLYKRPQVNSLTLEVETEEQRYHLLASKDETDNSPTLSSRRKA